jgi:hypothetical protein
MGDACEMLIAGELTLAGNPAALMPKHWRSYDLVVERKGVDAPQRISVKSRTFKKGRDAYVEYNIKDEIFDWLAIVLLPGDGQVGRRYFVVPRSVADARFHSYGPETKNHDKTGVQVDEIARVLHEFENNFTLSKAGQTKLD